MLRRGACAQMPNCNCYIQPQSHHVHNRGTWWSCGLLQPWPASCSGAGQRQRQGTDPGQSQGVYSSNSSASFSCVAAVTCVLRCDDVGERCAHAGREYTVYARTHARTHAHTHVVGLLIATVRHQSQHSVGGCITLSKKSFACLLSCQSHRYSKHG